MICPISNALQITHKIAYYENPLDIYSDKEIKLF